MSTQMPLKCSKIKPVDKWHTLSYFSFTSKQIIGCYQMKGRYLFKHALAQSPNCVGTHTEMFYARLMLIDMLIEKRKHT